jgi:L-ascorbate metabolism protein UlaG (beta-lactamase superfamily)
MTYGSNLLRRSCTTVVGVLLLSASLQAAEVEVTYLANEGVLITCGGDKVIVDALLRDSQDAYARHPRDVQEKLESGKPPFDGIGLALATHFHLDHWDAGAITRFLRSNPKTLFVSTPEATAMLPWSQREQVQAVWPEPDRSQQISRNDLQVSAFRLQHGTTQNLGYRISVCGRTLFHLGDSEGSAEDFSRLKTMGTADVVLVPFWWLLDAKSAEFLRKEWKPRHIVALHFATTSGDEAKKVRAAWPEAWVCWQQGESRKF